MSDFTTTTSELLDPNKRVKYSMGLVLGVEEFDQEQLYFIEKNRLHNRGLHGYGTVTGLKVSVKSGTETSDNPEILVEAGIAVSPQGQEIRISKTQCAKINTWLRKNSSDVTAALSSGTLRVYVVVAYRECETDLVPAPAGPCSTQDDSQAPSRIKDDFELKFTLTAPSQEEQEVVERFGALLARLRIGEGTPYLTEEQLKNHVRALLTPPTTPDDSPLYLEPATAQEYLEAAFRVWTTEVRPQILDPEDEQDSNGIPNEKYVALACLQMTVSGSGSTLAASNITVLEDHRPILLHTRLLQEWLMVGRFAGATPAHTFATLYLLHDRQILRVWVHHPEPLFIPLSSMQLEMRGGPDVVQTPAGYSYVGTNVFDLYLSPPLQDDTQLILRFDPEQIQVGGQTLAERMEEQGYTWLDTTVYDNKRVIVAYYTQIDHGTLVGQADDDHLQYLNRNGIRPMEGDLIMAHMSDSIEMRHQIKAMAQATIDGDAIPHGQPAAGTGDLTGNYPDQIVVRKLQGRPVSQGAPQDGSVLRWMFDGALGQDAWMPWLMNLDDLNDVIAPSPSDGQALLFRYVSGVGYRWIPQPVVKPGDSAAGSNSDLSGTFPDQLKVIRLQGRPVADAGPDPGQLLWWNSSAPGYTDYAWRPVHLRLAHLFDVSDTVLPVNNGDLLYWKGNEWVATALPGYYPGQMLFWTGTDYAVTAQPTQPGQVLFWNGFSYQVSAPATNQGQVMFWDGDGYQVSHPFTGSGQMLYWNGSDLTPTPSGSPGQILYRSATGLALSQAPGTNIGQMLYWDNGWLLTPTGVAPGTAHGSLMTWDGTKWVRSVSPGTGNGRLIVWTGSSWQMTAAPGQKDMLAYTESTSGNGDWAWRPGQLRLEHISNVVISNPQEDDVLTYDSFDQTWKNQPPPQGTGGNVTMDGDVTGPSNDCWVRGIKNRRIVDPYPQHGQFLWFNYNINRWDYTPVPTAGDRLVYDGTVWTLENGGSQAARTTGPVGSIIFRERDGEPRPMRATDGLQVVRAPGNGTRDYLLFWKGEGNDIHKYDPEGFYLVKGTVEDVEGGAANAAPAVIQYVGQTGEGIRIRIRGGDRKPTRLVMVEVTQL